MSEYSLTSTNVRYFAIIGPDRDLVFLALAFSLMPRKSVEDRLQSLQDKREALAAEIKQIQANKAQQLRKRQRQRETLVGRAIYQLVADGAVITADTWTEELVLQVMDGQLTRQRDRQLFGLSIKSDENNSISPAANDAVEQQKPSQSSNISSPVDIDNSSSSKRSPTLPISSGQSELMDEFNL